MRYDPTIIQEYAADLYRQAEAIVLKSAVGGAVLGLMFGVLLHSFAGSTFAIILAILGGIIGHQAGQRRAFELRLQAQQALCRSQIEENTRGLVDAPEPERRQARWLRE